MTNLRCSRSGAASIQSMSGRAEYPSFRRIFWEERAHNPGLSTAKLEAYGVEAHLRETEQHWRRKGVKFSATERRCKVRLIDETCRGPERPEEYKQFCERPQQYFGRVRRVRPLTRVSTSLGSVRPSRRQEPEPRPRSVYMPRDEWAPRPVCGMIRYVG